MWKALVWVGGRATAPALSRGALLWVNAGHGDGIKQRTMQRKKKKKKKKKKETMMKKKRTRNEEWSKFVYIVGQYVSFVHQILGSSGMRIWSWHILYPSSFHNKRTEANHVAPPFID
jgi:hypothetical protein